MNLHSEPLPFQSKNLTSRFIGGNIQGNTVIEKPLPFSPFTPKAESKPMPLKSMQKVALRAYEELLKLKNYSPNTISVYRNYFILFMNCFPDHKPSTITKNEIMVCW